MSYVSGSAFIVGMLISTAATAQTQGEVSSSPTERGVGVADIVVTAQKRSESLQRAAASIQVLSSEALVKQGVTNLRSLQSLGTGFVMSKQQTNSHIIIRGVGVTQTAPNTDPANAVILNGAVIASERQGSALFDLERVEVLKGPQGTLYGTNAAGGVISVSLRKPGTEFAADGLVEVGNYEYRRVQVGLDIPIGTDVQLRASGNFVNRDGYSSNGLDDERSRAGRLTLVAKPSPALSVLLWGDYVHMGGLGDSGYLFPARQGKKFFQPFPICCGQLSYDPADKARGRKADFWQIAGQVDLDVADDVTLSWIPSYQKVDLRGRLLIDGGGPITAPVAIQQTTRVDKSILSQELRLSGKTDDFEWLVGAYYLRQRWGEARNTALSRNYDVDPLHTSYSAYAQVKYSVTESLRLTGGLRYGVDKKECSAEECAIFVNNVRTPFVVDIKRNRIDWKAGVEYDLSRSSLFYATVQSGYLAPGFHIVGGGGTNPGDEVRAVKLLSYTGGWKNRLFDNRLTLNFEGFYYDYKDYQTGVLVFSGSSFGASQVFNVPKSRIYGLEANATFAPTRNDSISIGMTAQSAKFKDFTVPQNNPVLGQFVVDFSGFTMSAAPKLTANLNYQHDWEFSNGGRLSANVLTSYNSGYWTTISHGVNQCLTLNIYPPIPSCLAGAPRQKAYTLTNLSLTYNAPDDAWSLGLWMRNLENRAILGLGVESRPNSAAHNQLPPRTYGLMAKFKI
ncbi:TonB-dependent receptor domain-containing protein [Sphingobium sp.]|uniref:TonB-dependent receptor n=1 Tax=Sphingobium sp. TaxID=1912891 RepID=UPI0028BEF4E3|nr:TonB-dependent receptor [Sphingobium sp.]